MIGDFTRREGRAQSVCGETDETGKDERDQKSEVGGRRVENTRQLADRGKRTDCGSRIADCALGKAEDRGQKTEVRRQRTEGFLFSLRRIRCPLRIKHGGLGNPLTQLARMANKVRMYHLQK